MKIRALQDIPTLLRGDMIPAGDEREVEDCHYYRDLIRSGAVERVDELTPENEAGASDLHSHPAAGNEENGTPNKKRGS